MFFLTYQKPEAKSLKINNSIKRQSLEQIKQRNPKNPKQLFENTEAIKSTLESELGLFIMVSAGEFMMGGDRFEFERPPHVVKLSKSFEIGKYEVTQSQWQMVMGSNPSHFQGDNLPVENVSWNDVQVFLKKINQKNKEYQYRLPTEAEWEYSCRAGTKEDYSGDLNSMAWYINNSGKTYVDVDNLSNDDYLKTIKNNNCRTHEVGSKSPNDWGIHDMHGNVWEWCQDGYEANYYKHNVKTDPLGPKSGSGKVVRGGSWYNKAVSCRSPLRNFFPVKIRRDDVGFRLVRISKITDK